MDLDKIFLKIALKELKQNNLSDRVYIYPLIPEKKLKNAISCMGVPDNSPILVLIDDTLFKSGKGGACVTSDTIYWKQFLEKGSIKFNDIKQLETKFGITKVMKINGNEIFLSQFSEKEVQPLIDFLLEVTRLKLEPVTVIKKKAPDKYSKCGKCRGRGLIKCKRCKGNGRYIYHDWQTDDPIEEICDECGGSGLLSCPNPACEEGIIDWVSYLISALNNSKISVRTNAAETLGLMEDIRAVEPLIQALLEDEYAVVRGRAAIALGSLGDERAAEALIQALKDNDPWVSGVAKCALKKTQGG